MAHNPNTHTHSCITYANTQTRCFCLSLQKHIMITDKWIDRQVTLCYFTFCLIYVHLIWSDMMFLFHWSRMKNHLSLKMEKRFSWHRLSEAEAVDPLDTLLWCQSRYKAHEPHRKQTQFMWIWLYPVLLSAWRWRGQHPTPDLWHLGGHRDPELRSKVEQSVSHFTHSLIRTHTLTNPHTHTQSVRCLTCHVFLCRYFLSNEAGFSHRHLYRWDTLMLRRPRCFYSSSITLVTAAWPLIPRVSTVEPFHRDCLSCSVFKPHCSFYEASVSPDRWAVLLKCRGKLNTHTL